MIRGVRLGLPTEHWQVPVTVGLLVLLADQISKAWILAELGPEPRTRSIDLMGDWLRLVYIRNTGVAFGLFSGFPLLFTFVTMLVTAAVVVAFVRYLPNESRWIQTSIGLIVGGAIGNIIDRLRFGYVVDFVSVGWWPIFNIADSGVSVGVTMMTLYLLIIGEEPPPRVYPRDDALLTTLLNQDPAARDAEVRNDG